MEAYIYTYVNKETQKTYIGSRSKYKGKAEDDFNIKYFSSSRNDEFWNDMKNKKLEGQIILKINYENANKKIVEIEHKLISAYWEKYGKENSYNLYNNGKFNNIGRHPIPWDKGLKGPAHPNYGRKLSNETRKKISNATKGENNPAYGNKYFLGRHHSEETKLKLSLINKGKDMNGEKNPMYGKKMPLYKYQNPENNEIRWLTTPNANRYYSTWIRLSNIPINVEERKIYEKEQEDKKIIEKELQKIRTKEKAIKMSIRMSGENNPNYGKPGAMLGKHLSEEAKKKIGDANRGHKHSEETKKLISEKKKGVCTLPNGHTAETKARISKTKTGKPDTKYKFLNDKGEIVYLDMGNRNRWHKDWPLVE